MKVMEEEENEEENEERAGYLLLCPFYTLYSTTVQRVVFAVLCLVGLGPAAKSGAKRDYGLEWVLFPQNIPRVGDARARIL